MRIRLKVDISGTHDGVPWPPRGGEVDVPDETGAEMCAADFAEPVGKKDAKVEKAVVKSQAEERKSGLTTESTAPRRRGRPPGVKNKPKTDEG